ncbi:hypothetical protein [Amycolatopsis anabasis]|uniref:hypothetical protein n=1 Tax=Amycolatopsis anabasis TaxID=1840409 RepID=UPI00131CACB8|nr:hypothetical protein [Amycolatopsis anabasis]
MSDSPDSPEDEVVVFIVSKHSNRPYRRVLWRVTRADAMKICSDPRTSGAHHMLCWTAYNVDDPDLNVYVPDSGRNDDVLRDHHIQILAAYTGPRPRRPPTPTRASRPSRSSRATTPAGQGELFSTADLASTAR